MTHSLDVGPFGPFGLARRHLDADSAEEAPESPARRLLDLLAGQERLPRGLRYWFFARLGAALRVVPLRGLLPDRLFRGRSPSCGLRSGRLPTPWLLTWRLTCLCGPDGRLTGRWQTRGWLTGRWQTCRWLTGGWQIRVRVPRTRLIGGRLAEGPHLILRIRTRSGLR